MEPNTKLETTEENDQNEKPFCDRPYEEVEDGYIDDRGFYTTPNGSFWDEDHTYFNHLGFDKHGGSYDKYGVYQPGPDYDEKTGLYKDQKDLITPQEIADTTKMLELTISKLKEQGKKDEKTIKEYEQPVEDSEESDDEENITYDENEIKEAYENVMQNEKESQKVMEIKLSKKSNRSRSKSKPKD